MRQEKLASLGVHFLRFDDLEVKQEMGYVLDAIQEWIKQHRETEE